MVCAVDGKSSIPFQETSDLGSESFNASRENRTASFRFVCTHVSLQDRRLASRFSLSFESTLNQDLHIFKVKARIRETTYICPIAAKYLWAAKNVPNLESLQENSALA